MSAVIENSINAVRPSFILYADKPLQNGGKVEELAIDEFEKRLNIRYSDGVDLSENIKLSQLQFEEEIGPQVPSSVLKKQVDQLLMKGNTNLAIYNMGRLGHGAFAVKKIAKDAVIAIYSGRVVDGPSENLDDEGMSYGQYQFGISTEHHRGISSFLQHLPNRNFMIPENMFASLKKEKTVELLGEELMCTEFSSKMIKATVAIENVRSEYIKYKGFPVIVLVANETIEVGEIVGFNYGYSYWVRRELIPEYLDRKGNIIPQNLYRRTFGILHFGHCSYIGEFNKLIESFLKQKVAKFKLNDIDNQKKIVTLNQLARALFKSRAMPRNEIEMYVTLPKEDQETTINEIKEKYSVSIENTLEKV